jgi:hypothetical protein
MIIATVILAVAISGLCASLLAIQTWSTQERLKPTLSSYALELVEELKNYAADRPIPLPGAPGLPSWHLPGDTCQGCPGAPACWALETCTHDVSARLPAGLRNLHKARLEYTVSAIPSGAQVLHAVEIHVLWSQD